VEFLRVPSGAWIVRDWVIRMPRSRMVERPMAMGQRPEVAGFREEGGGVVFIKTRSGTVIYGTELAVAAVASAPPASAPAAAPAEPAAPTQRASATPVPDTTPVRSGARNPNLIARQEIEATTALDAYALVQESRPTWLHSRGTVSIRDPSAGMVQVYLNRTQLGDVNRLREIQLSEIRELRFFGAAEAQLRYGPGHAGGVIEVSTGAVAPTGRVVSAPTPPPAAAPASDSTRRPARSNRGVSAHNPNLLEADEFENSTALDAMALVQEFRPTWLHSRGVTSIRDQSAGEVKVYLNGVAVGDVNELRQIRAADVRELRFLGAAEAQQRYGLGHGGGVIEVWTR